MMKGDESYAGARSFYQFERAVQRHHRLQPRDPDAPGARCRAHPVLDDCCKPGDMVPNNTHFDTTRANVEDAARIALDLPVAEGRRPGSRRNPFKGNMDVAALERMLASKRRRVPLRDDDRHQQLRGGQPVSLANMRARERDLPPPRRSASSSTRAASPRTPG